MALKCAAVLGDHSVWKTETAWQLPGSDLLNSLAGSVDCLFLLNCLLASSLNQTRKKPNQPAKLKKPKKNKPKKQNPQKTNQRGKKKRKKNNFLK